MAGYKQDTIAAVATPLGTGGVGIVRMSGPACRQMADKIFVSARPSFPGIKPYRLHHGWIRNKAGRTLDEVLLAFMPGPGSYTGEDVLEINCHGGPAVLQAVLKLCLGFGARAAEPGEFTKRAFLNGRLDLSQAEAVSEAINARTSSSLTFAQNKLSGALRSRVRELRSELEELSRQFCLAVDFPDEDVQCAPRDELADRIRIALKKIDELVDNSERGSVWRNGAVVAMAGQVNAGKSSLLNCILGRERSIVTAIAGTTRDYIEEEVNIRGLPVRLVDTAGLRRTEDAVEQAGVDRCRELLVGADLILVVVDGVRGPDREDADILFAYKDKKVLVVANKSDLPGFREPESYPLGCGPEKTVSVSAKTGEGVDRLLNDIRELVLGNRPEPDPNALIPNARQKHSLEQASRELEMLLADLHKEVPFDLLGVRLDYASESLAEITGEIVSEDILNSIFDRFCIGK
ncbi:MAG: tRNA uridine-5-carboxymethylaminomethyl(34) synthesis GTPase MnmE [Desulfonatronovibrionaceae bacterium]